MQAKAFEKLKNKFILMFMLVLFDPEKKLILKTNVSNQALESYLSQPEEEWQLRPVAYWLKRFSGLKPNYDVQDKKLIVIVDIFEEWRAYWEESRNLIVVYSDHKNLSYFIITKKLNWQQI